MSPKTTIILALAAGFLGGTLSQRVMQVHAQEIPQEIRAHRFVLVDESGVNRGVLGFGKDGSAGIEVMDKKNHVWGLQYNDFQHRGMLPDATCQSCKHPKTSE